MVVALSGLTALKTEIFPNPFANSTTVLFDRSLTGQHDLLIYNVVGKEIRKKEGIVGDRVSITKAEVGEGLFMAFLVDKHSGKSMFVGKLIVQ